MKFTINRELPLSPTQQRLTGGFFKSTIPILTGLKLVVDNNMSRINRGGDAI